jgi:NTP pyrophosphatase (non-canonical NTP hydrolase)
MSHLWEVKHPYYATEGNYFDNDCHVDFDSWADFKEEGSLDADRDMGRGGNVMTYAVLARQLCDISHMIDTSASYIDCETETILWRRCAKVAEESGEVISALIGVTGENPRKGVTHTMGDVQAELLDVATTALCAVAHLHDNESNPVLFLIDHVDRVHARLRSSIEAAS